MSRAWLRLFALLLALATLPAPAQTRAWLDRDALAYGETTALNIETTEAVQAIDYAPLRQQFDIAGQTVRRSYTLANGRSTAKALFVVGLRPRGPGVLTVPALRVGNQATTPLRMTVLPPRVAPANGNADVFIDTVIDAERPYVQQAVGVRVRLHYAVPLMSGQLDQDPPPGASLQPAGEDLQYQREVGGRRYNVVERRFLLIPEHSGVLVLPGARFNGMAAGGLYDQVFDDGRRPLSAASTPARVQVRPIPADAPQPWLPLQDLQLRYTALPKQARVGQAATVEIELQADGAGAAQLPAITLADAAGVQVFADPPQSDEHFVDGRPRTSLRRRIALVPLKPGALTIPGPRIEWWDAAQGGSRVARLPPIVLQVQAGPVPAALSAPQQDRQPPSGADAPPAPPTMHSWMPWIFAAAAACVLLVAWILRRRREAPSDPAVALPSPASGPAPPSLAMALERGDLGGIAHVLCAGAGLAVDDLDGVRAHLDDPAQARALAQLQAARWGSADTGVALAALRSAFAGGARWRVRRAPAKALLPPLYPEP